MTLLLATSSSPSGAELLRDVKKLSVVGSALYVAAHPDDENTRLLATLANETMVRAAYLSLTRGEGGQNLIGQDLGPALGIIRTQELLAARRIDGAEQHFTRARDFGFSKSVDETLKLWDHDGVLADAVSVIRAVKPDVIITRFPLEAGETHGHHTASARIAVEAFKAAGDAAFHPELGAPWQARRIAWNAWSPDPKEKLDLSKAVQLDSSVYSPLLGFTYGELAAESRSQHKSQGFGAAPVHGPSTESFIVLAGDAGKSLFDGVELSWARVPGSQPLQKLLRQAADGFRADNPAASIPVLLQALGAMRKLPEHPWKAQKLAELERVIAGCAGVFVEAAAASYSAVPGDKVDVVLTALVRGDTAAVKLKEIRLSDGQTLPATATKASLTVAGPFTTPAWLEGPVTAPEPEAPLWADFVFDAFTVRRPVVYKWTDPIAGERYRQVELLPPVLVKPDASLLVFADGNAKALEAVVTSNADGQSGELVFTAPEGWTVTPAKAPYTLAKRGDAVKLTFQVKPPKAAGAATLSFGAKSLTRIEYAHIPMQTWLTPAETKLVRFDLARGKTKLGYIAGAGDDVPRALRQVGYEVTLLDDEALATKRLEGFDAIVVGIRAFNTNPRLASHHARLMQYVSAGGTLLVQYNTKNRISDVPAEIGPYPFEISRDRVTDENAAVSFAQPVSPALVKPNPLGPADFEGWVQERGLYFASTWDARYQTPLEMHDPNEPPKKGSLIIGKHGKGTFIYTGLAFFRQLPAGVPGAYRLFANLLANGR